MKEKSKQIRRYFSFGYDSLDTLKHYLEDMAKQGWMFVEYTGMRLVFEPCEARELNFAVEIFDKTSQYATFCNEENLEYIEYCEQAGWHYISSFGVLQFFYSEDLELTPIETDDRMKWESIWKAGKPNRFSIGLILPLCAIMQLFTILGMNPLGIFLSYINFANLIVWSALLINGIVYWIRTLLWRKRCLKSIEAGEGIIPQKHMTARQGYTLLAGILCLWSGGGILTAMITGDHSPIMICVICVLVVLMLPVILWARRLAVRLKLSPSMNLFMQLALGIGFGFLLMVAAVVMVLFLSLWDEQGHSEWEFSVKEAGKKGEVSFTVPVDDVAFFFDDAGNLIEQPQEKRARKDSGYSTKQESDGHFLLQLDSASQTLIWNYAGYKQEKAFAGMFPTEGIDVHYEMYQSRFACLLDLVEWWGRKGRISQGSLDYPFEKAEMLRTEETGKVYCYYDENAVTREEDFEYYQYLFRKEHSILKLLSSRELPAETIEELYQILP